MDPDFGPLDPFDQFEQFDNMFSLATGLFAVVSVVVLGLVIWGFVRAGVRTARNAAAPEVQAAARIVDKRSEVSGGGVRHQPGLMGADGLPGPGLTTHDPVSAAHFVTFEQPGGERFELAVPSHQYGLLVVGDSGTVTMKGDRFLGFQREILR